MGLLMAFFGADLPGDQYRHFQSLAATLPPSDATLTATRLRSTVMSHAEWIKTDRERYGVADQWRRFFRDWDVVLCPIMPTPAFPHDHSEMNTRRIAIDGKEVPYMDQFMWPGIATLTGLPATAMPIGHSEEGLPIGMQIVGPCLEDRTTLAFAELAEREFGGFVAPPAFRA
jgi:amidase